MYHVRQAWGAVIIFLGNITVLLLGIPLIAAKVDVLTSLGWWLECTGKFFHDVGKML